MGRPANRATFPDSPVQCYYSNFDFKPNSNYKFYDSFKLRKTLFTVGDVVHSNLQETDCNLIKILCIYSLRTDSNTATKAIVRKFIKHEGNEVIEDLRDDYTVNVDEIESKCVLIYVEDNSNNLDETATDNYYRCRYSLTESGLTPILSLTHAKTLTENTNLLNSPKLSNQKRKLSNQRTPSNVSDDENDCFARTKMKSPKNAGKSVKLDICSPIEKHPVRRNLNNSFGNSPDKRQSRRNYSIVSDDDDNPLILKLKISGQNISPTKASTNKVVIRKINDEYRCQTDSGISTSSPIRRSTRISQLQSANSPMKDLSMNVQSMDLNAKSPRKRTRSAKKPDLDSSIRSNLLKARMTELKLDVTPPKVRKSMRPRRGSTAVSYAEMDLYESGEERYTPRKTLRSRSNSTSQVEAMRTPRPKTKVAATPQSRIKLIRDGTITPSLQNRECVVAGDSTPLMKARTQLHVSYVPLALPGREKEYVDVFNFIQVKLQDGCGGCMYISGVPGTGKTATVSSVIKNLEQFNDDVPQFDFVSINGMKLTEPRQSYVEIFKQLTGKTVPWEQAQSLLEDRFTRSKKAAAPCVMLIDELDILCTKRQDVVYNLLDWPTKARTQLIVITIANTMDLPERLLMSRVTSRLGLTRLTFQAYTHKQLQNIVVKRLTGNDSFNPDAIQFVARKVASVSGDARRALDICRRAAEVAELESATAQVTMQHVNVALNEMITQPKVQAIRRCSRLEKLMLQAVVAEVERTGVEETTFADVHKMLIAVAALDGFKMVSTTIALSGINRLSACRLILTDPKCNDIYKKIILNVSIDDVYYALKRV